MNILINLLITAFTLYFYLYNFMDNINDREFAIPNKIYMFIFVFIIQFLTTFITNVRSKDRITIGSIIENSVNNALLSVVAYDIYNDLIYLRYYQGLSARQQILILVLLIIGFMASIKILQLLVTN